jgi:excisionase family DNA binding protein
MIMSINQAAEYLSVSTHTLRYLARNGRIPAGKIGRSWRFSKVDLDNFLRYQYEASVKKIAKEEART